MIGSIITMAIASITGKRNILAKEIRELTKDVAVNSIEMGRKLLTAQKTFPPKKGGHGGTPSRPGWEDWCKKEVGLSKDMVKRLIQIAKKFPVGTAIPTGASRNVLRLLASSATTPEAHKTIVDKLDKGETVTEAEAKEIVHKVNRGQGITKKEIGKVSSFYGTDKTLPKPKEARKEARDTGMLVLASDGYYYTPATDDQIKMGEKQRHLVFGMRRAVEMLASIDMTPHQFIDFAPDYILPTEDDERRNVREAAKWLNAFAAAWEIKADTIKQQIEQRVAERKEKEQKKLKDATNG